MDDKRTDDMEWEDLLFLISEGARHPEDTQWAIFRYLQRNYKTMDSVMARTLLAAYMKLYDAQPSLINSCMLGMALKVSARHADFRLPAFLEAWGYDKVLRPDDRQPQTGKDGRRYPSLQQRVERALKAYQRRGQKPRGAVAGAKVPAIVGYVGGIDDKRGHVHVYDPQSRHFVADKQMFKYHQDIRKRVTVGSFVMFRPVITEGNPFKRASIQSVLSEEEGLRGFGTYTARVDYINLDDGYIRYTTTQPLRETPEGELANEGFASIKMLSEYDRQRLRLGGEVRLLLFLKRGKDGVKRNHVAKVCLCLLDK